ncbi:hypothetical protein [Roseovarius sp.]|uniref:hypothetical protein n=1 Tax=Roseovarius sp. TaxID=1486281 RepID=UPI003B5AC6CE
MSKKKSKNKPGAAGTEIKPADAATIVEDAFGNYLIRAGRLNGDFIARAFPATGSRSQGLIAEASGTSEADAIEALKENLRARSANRTEARRWDERSDTSIPGKEEFIEALRQMKLTDAQLAMLRAHAVAGDDGMTLAALTRASGYKSEDTAMKALKRAGSLVGDFLGLDPRSDAANDPRDAREVLGYLVEADTETASVWVMHTELRNAVRSSI